MNIKDNVLGPSLFKKLYSSVFNANIPYYFSDTTAYLGTEVKNNFDFSWSHLVYDDGQIHSSLCSFLESVFLTSMDATNQKVEKLLRIRIGLITPTAESLTHGPHIDREYAHKTAILYLNDSNGPTYVYKETYDTNSSLNSIDYLKMIKTVNVLKEFESKANRLVWFDGLHYHSSNTPTNVSRRIAITFNYV